MPLRQEGSISAQKKTIIKFMDRAKISETLRKIYYFPNKPPVKPDPNAPIVPPVELTPEERRAKFRRVLTDRVSAGWHLEIENDYDAVISRKKGFNWLGSLFLFIILLFLVAPLAIFYLVVLAIVKITAKPRMVKIWIDIYGNIKTNA